MATTPVRLMTFAEFELLPNPPAGRYELRKGELVHFPPPNLPHTKIQWRLRRLLEHPLSSAGVVGTELGFRLMREHEYRIADVAFVSRKRWDQATDYLNGAPDLVIEVLSPSISRTDMIEKMVCA